MKFSRKIERALNIIVFFGLFLGGAFLVARGATTEGFIVWYAGAFYMVFTKLENIDERFKELE